MKFLGSSNRKQPNYWLTQVRPPSLSIKYTTDQTSRLLASQSTRFSLKSAPSTSTKFSASASKTSCSTRTSHLTYPFSSTLTPRSTMTPISLRAKRLHSRTISTPRPTSQLPTSFRRRSRSTRLKRKNCYRREKNLRKEASNSQKWLATREVYMEYWHLVSIPRRVPKCS